jgi:Spy/CpxP family protein refolding chaperone
MEPPAIPGRFTQLPAWAKTLTQSQREQIEHMHHQLDDDQAPHKKREAQALAELNAMTIREDADIADVNAKIDELMAAKTQIMRQRYEHLIEMRSVLTDEQKVGYDEGLLKRSAVR